jgi:15-cis-phytoene desaturase
LSIPEADRAKGGILMTPRKSHKISENARPIETDVVIVGGGLAGLTCAVALLQSGLRVVVVEREEVLGGRARSWADEKTGDPVDIGPHIFVQTLYPNMMKLLGILGTEDRVIGNTDRLITLVEGPERHDLTRSSYPPPFHALPWVLADPGVSLQDQLSNVPVTLYALQMDESDILEIDETNASAFLRSMGVTRRYIDRFWAFISLSIMNVPVDLCSAGALLRFYRRLVGHSRYNIAFPDRGLGELFAPQARARIEEAGGTILMNTEVTAFTGDEACTTGVRLADGRLIRARFCVSSLPPQELRRALPRAWLDRHASFRDLAYFQPSPYVSTYIWFDRKLTDLKFWARTYEPQDLNCDFYDLSNINRGWKDRPSVIASNIIYCYRATEMTDGEIVCDTVRELAEFLPDATRAKVVHWDVHRIPMAIPCPHPCMERRRPPARTPIQGLLLAGDWTRTGLPSSMESAAFSGWRAADEVLAEIGRPHGLVVAHEEIEAVPRLIGHLARLRPSRLIYGWRVFNEVSRLISRFGPF